MHRHKLLTAVHILQHKLDMQVPWSLVQAVNRAMLEEQATSFLPLERYICETMDVKSVEEVFSMVVDPFLDCDILIPSAMAPEVELDEMH